MNCGRVGSGCMGCFEIALLVHRCVLPLVGLVVLTGWGAMLLVTAHAVHPMATTAIVVDPTDWFKGTTCQETSLQGDTRNYRLFNDAQQPPVPRDRPGAGEHVTLWFDPDIDWANVSQTRVLALSLAEEPTDRPDHRPGCAWERFSGRRPRDLLEEVP